MSNAFTILSIIVLIVFAALQAIRLWLGLDIAVNGGAIPQGVSALALILALLLVAFLWIELNHTRDRARDVTVRRSGRQRRSRDTNRSRSASRAKPKPVWVQNGQRLPPNYFMFAANGLSAQRIREAADKHGRILVGFDSGAYPEAQMRAAREVGAELEVYVEGPGGPTGDSWAPDESARVKKAAASVGVNTKKGGWMKEWDAWAWKAFTFKQLEAYLEEGYSSAEIDNLHRAIGETPRAHVAFYKEYAERCLAGRLPRLVMKNISDEQMEAVVAAVENGTLPRAMFSEFHISERGSGDRKIQDQLSSRIGIRTVASNDTYNYDAFGEYALHERFAQLLPPPTQPAPTPTQVATPAPQAPVTAPATPPATPVAPAAPPAPPAVATAAAPTTAGPAQQQPSAAAGVPAATPTTTLG